MDIIISWFSNHPITLLQLITVSLMLKRRNTTVQPLRDHYVYVIDLLVRDKKISSEYGNDLIREYDHYNEIGLVDDFVLVAYNISEDPNVLNPGVWIRDNTFGRVNNSCFPCLSLIHI